MKLLFSTLITIILALTLIPGCEEEDDNSDIPSVHDDFIVLINTVRSNSHTCGDSTYAPAHTVRENEKLNDAAKLHARDMGENNYLDVESPQGISIEDRIISQNYKYILFKALLAQGNTSPENVIQAWRNEPEYCRAIMNPNFTEIGAGYYAEEKYWVVIFAQPE
jgi:uncharacterized protein YkwD